MGSAGRFKRIASTIGGWQKLLGAGMEHFFSTQDPDNVEFVQYQNGYAIEVKTDPQSAQEAKEFWETYVQERLKDGE